MGKTEALKNIRTTEAVKTHESSRFGEDLRTWLSNRLQGKRKSSSSENAENPELTGALAGEDNFNNMSNILDELGQDGIETHSFKETLIRGALESFSVRSSPDSQPEISKAVRHKRNILDPTSMLALDAEIAGPVTPFCLPEADTPICRSQNTDDEFS